MLRLQIQSLNRVLLLVSIIIVLVTQQIKAVATPATGLLKRAQALLDSKKNEAALACLNTLIAKEPNNALAYMCRATALRRQGKFENALADCSKAVKLSPKSARPYVERGHTYVHLAKFRSARDDLTVAIKIDPRFSEAYWFRSEAYENLGEYQKQIDDLTSAIKINPKDVYFYERRGYAYQQVGQLHNAIADCSKATDLNPALPCALGVAAQVYDELGLYEKSIAAETKLIDLMPKDAFLWSERALEYDLIGKFDLAESDRKKAMALGSLAERADMQLRSPLIDFGSRSSQVVKESIDRQLKDRPVVLPFHYDEGGHICVPVQVNDHSLQFMLDTGCNHTELWNQAMPGVAAMDKVQLQGRKASGKKYHYGFFRARDFKLGHLTLPDVAIRVAEGLPGHKTLSGFLGGNILDNFAVTVDYTKKQVILAAAFEQDKSKHAIVVPMTVRAHCPRCIVRLDGKLDRMALLDTGGPCGHSADALLKPILGKKLVIDKSMSGPWLDNLNAERIRVRSIELGAAKFDHPTFDVFPASEAPDAATEVVVGNSILSRFKTVTFDYPRRQIIFEPSDTASDSAPSLVCAGQYYVEHNKMPQAVDSFSRAMLLDKEFALACYHYRSIALVNMKEYQKALADATAAIKIDPTAAWNYSNRAWVYEMLGQYDNEIADDTTAIELDPQFERAYINRAWVYDKLGKHESAKRDRLKAKELSRH